MSFHQTVILGNLGRDPELKYLPNGRAVASFTVAVNERWTDKQTNERKEKTYWYRVSVFGQQAETCAQYLAKGRQVLVVGRVSASAYLDKNNQPQASLELNATDVRFVGGQGMGAPQAEGQYEEYGGPDTNISDIPF